METTFPQRLAMVLNESNLNQTDFSKRIRISQPFLSQLLSGKKTPSEQTIGYICIEFGINEEWLCYGEGQMKSNTSREAEIEALINSALKGSSDFKKAVIKAICSRSERELEILEKMLWDIVYNLPKEDHKPNRIIKIAGRDGSMEELALTDEDENEYLNRIDQYPDATDDL